jgi:deoxyribose-phosphate aldolase
MPLTDAEPSIARRLLGLMDLTSLQDDDDAASVRALASLSVSRGAHVAAFCTWPRFVPIVCNALRDTGVAIAGVANFPAGGADASAAAGETAALIRDGATEVDVVFPYRAFLSGDSEAGLSLVRACRTACGPDAVLKVILETGQLQKPEQIQAAAHIAIDGGAHFLKTSTGKTQPGATPQAVSALLEVIAAARTRGRVLGLKVSGGVRSIEQAQSYIDLYEQTFGPGSAVPAAFRIGASALIKPVLAALE